MRKEKFFYYSLFNKIIYDNNNKKREKKRGLGLSVGKFIVMCFLLGIKYSWGEGRRGYLLYIKNLLVIIILVV